MKPLVIFHSINGVMHCDDGFAAAWVAWKFFDGKSDFHPGIYGEAPPDCRDRQVYLLDFSYKRAEMLKLVRDAASLVVLDHHKTAQAELHGLEADLPDHPITIRFDMDRSGAVLAWEHFFPGEEPPELLRRVEDGDLWRWSYGDSKEVQAALRSYPQTFDVWSELMTSPIRELAADGAAIRRFIEAKIRELLPNIRIMEIAGHRVPAVASPKFLASELAGELVEMIPGAPFAAAYEDGATQRTFSLRSRGSFDVSEVARKFGGGGHRNAAGFQVPLP